MYLNKKDTEKNHELVKIRLADEVTFLNKANIRKELNELKENSTLELDITQTKYLDYDVIEILNDFVIQAKNKNIYVNLKTEKGNIENPSSYMDFFKLNKNIN